MADYSKMTDAEFDSILERLVEETPRGQLLMIPGIYEVLKEHFNDEVLDRWSEAQEYHRLLIVPSEQFGVQWECQLPDGIEDVWTDESDLVDEIRGAAFRSVEIGREQMPAGVFDIRGQVLEEPHRIFALQLEEGDPWTYEGIRHVSTL